MPTRKIWGWCGLLLGLLGAAAAGQEPIALVHRWEVEPPLDAQWRAREAQLRGPVDLQRLSSEIDEYQLSEARWILQAGRQFSDEDRQAAIEVLFDQLRAGEANRQVRQTLVAACVQLADDSQVTELWEIAQADSAVAPFVERELISRQLDPAAAIWLERVGDPQAAESGLLLAIEGLAAIGEVKARDQLLPLLLGSQVSLPVRLAVAESLGRLVESGLEEVASDVLATTLSAKELMAARLLRRHDSDAAASLQSQVLQSEFGPAQAVAYQWFADHRLPEAQRLAATVIDHPDHSLRLMAVNVLQQAEDAASLRLMGQRLSDPIPLVRRTVREHLVAKASLGELRPVVDEIVRQQLTGEAYAGSEQAILVVVALRDQSQCPKLVKLLDHPRPEVNIRAAWGLQQIAEDPAVLADILKHCQYWTEPLVNYNPEHIVEDTDIYRLSFLFEALGHNAYRPADGLLRIYVPKNSQKMRPTTRISAIWALGKIWQGTQDSGLEQPIAARLLDASVDDPEEEPVKFAAAIALGFIGNPASRDALASAPDEPPAPIGVAVAWALEQLPPAPQ